MLHNIAVEGRERMGRHVQAQVKVPVDGARAGDDDLIKASQLRQDGESMRARFKNKITKLPANFFFIREKTS